MVQLRPLEKKGQDLPDHWLVFGDAWEVGEDLVRELKEFACVMYGTARYTSVDELCVVKLNEKCDGKPTTDMRNVDMGTLPPCRMFDSARETCELPCFNLEELSHC